MKDIAYSGNYVLTLKTYMGEHVYTTHDIEICKVIDGSRVSVAGWVKGILFSCDNRLLGLIDTMDDLNDIRRLTEIGYLILGTELKEIVL